MPGRVIVRVSTRTRRSGLSRLGSGLPLSGYCNGVVNKQWQFPLFLVESRLRFIQKPPNEILAHGDSNRAVRVRCGGSVRISVRCSRCRAAKTERRLASATTSTTGSPADICAHVSASVIQPGTVAVVPSGNSQRMHHSPPLFLARSNRTVSPWNGCHL